MAQHDQRTRPLLGQVHAYAVCLDGTVARLGHRLDFLPVKGRGSYPLRRFTPTEGSEQWQGSRRSPIRIESLKSTMRSWTRLSRPAARFRGRSRCFSTVRNWLAVSPISARLSASKA